MMRLYWSLWGSRVMSQQIQQPKGHMDGELRSKRQYIFIFDTGGKLDTTLSACHFSFYWKIKSNKAVKDNHHQRIQTLKYSESICINQISSNPYFHSSVCPQTERWNLMSTYRKKIKVPLSKNGRCLFVHLLIALNHKRQKADMFSGGSLSPPDQRQFTIEAKRQQRRRPAARTTFA